MALILKNPGSPPLGQFDCLDGYVSTVKGGEVMTWFGVQWSGSDEAAADVTDDGYVGTTSKTRPALVFAYSSTNAPLFLSDDGIAHYGTLLGAVVGGTVGQQSNGPNSYTGAVLGPSSALGSGKVTVWDKQGLYGVTLDAVDSANLKPTNSALTVGSALGYTSAGLLTPAANGVGTVVGYLSEFQTNQSFVTTQQFMISALNSPSGNVSSLQQETFYQAEFWFIGASA